MRRFPVLFSLVFIILSSNTAIAQDFDVVLSGGRVMDPESGLDAIRDVAVRGGKVVAISEKSLTEGLREQGTLIDARGLVVAPGFIDLHAHGQGEKALRYRVRDGVTSALDLESGYMMIDEWLASRAGRSRIHYGASVNHGLLRALA